MGGAAPTREDCWLLGKGMDAGEGGAEVNSSYIRVYTILLYYIPSLRAIDGIFSVL